MANSECELPPWSGCGCVLESSGTSTAHDPELAQAALRRSANKRSSDDIS
jgi:hypothetical protein